MRKFLSTPKVAIWSLTKCALVCQVLDTIAQKKRQFNKFAKAGLHSTTKSSASKPSKPTPSPSASTPAQKEKRTIRPTVETQSPEKEMLEKQIDKFRVEYEVDTP